MTTTNYSEFYKEIAQLPVPSRTRTYEPVAYKDLVHKVHTKIVDSGYTTKEFKYATTWDKQHRMANKFEASIYIDIPDSDLGLAMGIISSHDKSIPVTLAAQGIVRVCYNGMISKGNVLEVRRHTKNVWEDIDSYIDSLVGQLETCFKGCKEDIRMLLEAPLKGEEVVHYITGKAWNLGVFDKVEHLDIFNREWKLAQLGKGNFHKPVMWSLYNWGTEALKKSSIANKYEQHQKWHDLILNDVGVYA